VILVEKSRLSLTSIDLLRRLLSYGESLTLETPEEKGLRQVLMTLDDVISRFKIVFPFIEVFAESTSQRMQSRKICPKECGNSTGINMCLASAGALSFDRNSMQRYHYSPCQLEVLLSGDAVAVSKADFNISKPSLDEAISILEDAARLPIKINEMVRLGSVCQFVETVQQDIAGFLSFADKILYSKAKTILDRGRPSLQHIENLLTIAESLPFQLPFTGRILSYLDSGRRWLKEVVALNDIATANVKSVGGKSKSTSSQSQPVPLKRLDALISLGERLPFDFREEMAVLATKKQLAKVWLEKLRKSFVPTKVTSSRLRKGFDDISVGDPLIEKPSLKSMKLMVSEGEQLFRDDNGEDTERVAGVTYHRDLDRAVGLVDEADLWIDRVRDLLCPVVDNDDPSGSTLDSEQITRAPVSIILLRNILDDVDNMPVAIEEAEILKNYLRVLQWCDKVRPYFMLVATQTKSIVDAISETSTAVAHSHIEEDRRAKRPRTTRPPAKHYEEQKTAVLTLKDAQSFVQEILGYVAWN
jgi:hypothetical protein